MDEIWKELVYHNKLIKNYYVSNKGRFKGPSGKIRTLTITPSGYVCSSARIDKKDTVIRIHRAVIETHGPKNPNPLKYDQVNHIDGNKQNNCVENLEWCDGSYNTRHAYANSLAKAKRGWNHPNHKLTEEDVNYILANYKPRDKEFGTRGLGRKFNVPHTTISRICRGFNYADCDHKIKNKITDL